jgi:hypothetical protein
LEDEQDKFSASFPTQTLPYLIVHPWYGQSKQFKSEVAAMSAKYVFVTGGVVSSLGKGLAAASIGCLLESRGLRVNLMKFDPTSTSIRVPCRRFNTAKFL